jgi:CRISPR system Cascade subunit CasA
VAIDARDEAWQSGVLACGFDMDNMKARGWLEARIPYFHPPNGVRAEEWAGPFVATARRLVAGAEEAGNRLRYYARMAKFGSRDRENRGFMLSKTSPGKNACEDLYETFWRETEKHFREALDLLRSHPDDKTRKAREEFLKALRREALRLFDEAAGTDDLLDQDAGRIVDARSRLAFAFGETGSVRDKLGVVSAEAQQKADMRRGAKKKAREQKPDKEGVRP